MQLDPPIQWIDSIAMKQLRLIRFLILFYWPIDWIYPLREWINETINRISIFVTIFERTDHSLIKLIWTRIKWEVYLYFSKNVRYSLQILERSIFIPVDRAPNMFVTVLESFYVNLIVLIAVAVTNAVAAVAFDPHSWWWYRKQTA